MSNIKVDLQGHIAVITGPGFEFKKVDDLVVFTQTGKIPSIRAAKVVCKLLTSRQGA